MCWLIPNPLFTVPEIPGPDVLQTSGSIPSIWAYFVKSTWEFFHNRLGWPSWAAVSTLDGQGFLGSRCVALSSRAEGSEKTAHLILSLYFRPRLTVQTCPLFHALGQIDLGALQPMRHISGLKEKKKSLREYRGLHLQQLHRDEMPTNHSGMNQTSSHPFLEMPFVISTEPPSGLCSELSTYSAYIRRLFERYCCQTWRPAAVELSELPRFYQFNSEYVCFEKLPTPLSTCGTISTNGTAKAWD